MKTIILSNAAAKDLDGLPPKPKAAVEDGLIHYAVTGEGDVKKLAGRSGYRLRIGRYRVLFAEDACTILAVYIGKRETTTYRQVKPNAPVKIQIIHTPSGEAMAVLPLADYEALLAAAEIDEDARDIAIFDARMREIEAGDVPLLPAEVSMDILRGASRLSALRRWRGLSQKELARRAGITQGFLSDMERRRRTGASATIDRLAGALDVSRIWLG